MAIDLFKKFSFDDTPRVSVDEHAQNPGNQESPPSTGAVSDATRREANQAATDELRVSPRRRGRPRLSESASTGRVTDRELQERVNAAITQQLDAINSPQAWQALLTLPALTAQAMTGHERWKLSTEEKETLGLTGSAAGKTMMITNPRMLALAMLSASLVAIYGPRAVGQLQEMIEKKKKAEENKT